MDVHGASAVRSRDHNIPAIPFLCFVSEEKPPVANSTAYFICGWGAVLGAQRGHTAMNIREAVLYKCISQHTDNPKKKEHSGKRAIQYSNTEMHSDWHGTYVSSGLRVSLALPLTLCGRWSWHQEQLEAFPVQARSAGLQQSVSLGQ
jgi:hypothetical protein